MSLLRCSAIRAVAAEPKQAAGVAARPRLPIRGNYHDKYDSSNPAVRLLTERFLARLEAAWGPLVAERSDARVLEVGCGEGEIARRLAARWAAVSALDLPDAELRRRWAGIPAVKFCHGDAERLPFPDDAFDVVVAVEVLEHVRHPEIALREMARVCAGHLVLSVPREPIFRLGNLATGRHARRLGNTPGHVNHWTLQAFVQLVAAVADVEVVERPLPWTLVVARVASATARRAGQATAGSEDAVVDGRGAPPARPGVLRRRRWRRLPPAGELPDDAGLMSAAIKSRRSAVNYQSWLASLALPWLGANPLEVGSGFGDYAAEWAAAGQPVTASESDPERLAVLCERFEGTQHVAVRELRAPIEERGDYSAVVSYNVLEHIRDDLAALRSFANLAAPGGHVITLVPAFPIAMSDYDRQIGHYRRYRRAGLERLHRAAGLEVLRTHHVNAPGLPLWILTLRLIKLRRTGRGTGGLTRLYDRVVPAVAAVESRRRPPFGQSLFAVARVPLDRPR